mmetsp:Transcript_7093/g.29526  ORF Transcript_7093/g.29526 Transcript_7093/m.29526 type:complete len:235 (-) Transcript_7093:169-873(-)
MLWRPATRSPLAAVLHPGRLRRPWTPEGAGVAASRFVGNGGPRSGVGHGRPSSSTAGLALDLLRSSVVAAYCPPHPAPLVRCSAAVPPRGAAGALVVRREKHSKRMIKKMNYLRSRKDGTWKPAAERAPKPPPPPYNVEDLGELPNGWTPPPAHMPTGYPFAVERSKYGWLPVYSKYRSGNAHTLVRHVIGDVDAFVTAVKEVTDIEPVRKQGVVELKGHHVVHLRRWLAHLGF